MSSKAEEFNRLVHEVFAPCYPVIAGQILEKAGLQSNQDSGTDTADGLCLDLGCGPGFLGLAIAEASSLELCMLDQDPEMLDICRHNAEARNLENRVRIQPGDVHAIPLPDNSVRLAVSRGSVFFWEDLPRAFSEIHRVLAPGGMAYIGGGFGNPELKMQIDEEMDRRSPEWKTHQAERIGPGAPEKYRQFLFSSGIEDYEFDHGPAGMWIIFNKGEQGQ